jgi:ATP-dependent Clp protease ATP-binding subunit ClpA
VRLHIRRDAAVCRNLAEGGYSSSLGARSLITAVKQVEDLLVDAYLGDEDEISERNEMQDCFVDVKNGEIVMDLIRRERRQGEQS